MSFLPFLTPLSGWGDLSPQRGYVRQPVAPEPEQPTPLSSDQEAVMKSLGYTESGNNYSVTNPYGYMGKYQFGRDRLKDLGYGDVTNEAFLSDPNLQEEVMRAHLARIDQDIARMGLDKYEGQTVGGVPINRRAMYAMAHLGGMGGLSAFLKSGGADNRVDANATSIGRYGKMHGNGAASTFADNQAKAVADIQTDMANAREELSQFEINAFQLNASPEELQKATGFHDFVPMGGRTDEGIPKPTYRTASLDSTVPEEPVSLAAPMLDMSRFDRLSDKDTIPPSEIQAALPPAAPAAPVVSTSGTASPPEGETQRNPWMDTLGAWGLGLSQLGGWQVPNLSNYGVAQRELDLRQQQEDRLSDAQAAQTRALAQSQVGRAQIAELADNMGMPPELVNAIRADSGVAGKVLDSILRSSSATSPNATDEQRKVQHYQDPEVRNQLAELAEEEGKNESYVQTIRDDPYFAASAADELNKVFASDRKRGAPLYGVQQDNALSYLEGQAQQFANTPRGRIAQAALDAFQQEQFSSGNAQTLGDIMTNFYADVRDLASTEAGQDVKVGGAKAIEQFKHNLGLETLSREHANKIDELAVKEGYNVDDHERTIAAAIAQEERAAAESDRVANRDQAIARANNAYELDLNRKNNAEVVDQYFGGRPQDPVGGQTYDRLMALGQSGKPLTPEIIQSTVKQINDQVVQAAEAEKESRATTAMLNAADSWDNLSQQSDDPRLAEAANLLRSGNPTQAMKLYEIATGETAPEKVKLMRAIQEDEDMLQNYMEAETLAGGQLPPALDSVKKAFDVQMSERAKALSSQRQKAESYRVLRELAATNPDASFGGFPSMFAPFEGYLRDLGIGLSDNVTVDQVFRAVAADASKHNRIPGEGASSNYDVELNERIAPALGNERISNVYIGQINEWRENKAIWTTGKINEWMSNNAKDPYKAYNETARNEWLAKQEEAAGWNTNPIPELTADRNDIPGTMKMLEEITNKRGDNILVEVKTDHGSLWYITGQDKLYTKDGKEIE